MRIDGKQLENLISVLSISSRLGIDSLVITNGRVGGASADRRMAIISEIDLGLKPDVKLGIGRIKDLEKRLSLFANSVVIDGKVNDNNDVSIMTLASGRSKMQYRCTAEKLIRYPKENADTPSFVVTLSKDEAALLSKAVKTLGAETVVLKVSRDCSVGFEAIDPTNEQFSMGLEKKCDFVGDAEPTVVTYKANNFTSIIDLMNSESLLELVIGEGQSLTAVVHGYSIVVMPYVSEDSDE